MKKFISNILLLIFLTLSCKDKDPTEPHYDPDAVRVAGEYKAATFLMPGQKDGLIDIILIGGSLTVKLNLDFSISGKIKIPKHPDIQGDGFDETFIGNYSVNKDTLQFKDTGNILSISQFLFRITENKLEGELDTQSPLTIILEKQ